MKFWPIATVLAGSGIVMFIGWLVQRRTRNAGIVDVLWSACMAAAAVFYGWVGEGALLSRVTVAVLGAAWGGRLGWHLLRRVLSESEDGRYLHLREHWHDNQGKFLVFFQAQALITALFSFPFYSVAENPSAEVGVFYLAGILIWLISVVGETIADNQLAEFRKDEKNAGRTCRIGLWRYSRHPNYFFEWIHWFSYVCLAVGVPFWVWLLTLLGPILMLASLYWVTGIPFVEMQALRSRGDDYRAYQRSTNALIPWFPKSE